MTFLGRVEATYSYDSLWVEVERYLTRETTNTFSAQLPDYIKNRYASDTAALEALTFVRHRVESELFDLPLAAALAETTVDLAGRTSRPEEEARAWFDLSRYYHALRFDRRGTEALDRAIQLYATTDNRPAYDHARIYALNRLGLEGDYAGASDGLKALAAAADYPGGDRIQHIAYRRLIMMNIAARDTTSLRAHIRYLDTQRAHYRDVDTQIVEETVIHGRAFLARFGGRYQEAIDYLERAAAINAAEPDHWRAANAHLQQAYIASEMGRTEAVRTYLKRAQAIAAPRAISDILVEIYRLQTELAIADGDYRAAFGYRDQQLTHRELLRARTENFNYENYYLRKEKAQLELERAAQRALVASQHQRLLLLRIAIGLGFGLLAALIFGLYYQRRARRKLAGQYAITERQAAELRVQEQARTRFFTNVSHELRTPLTLVLNPIRALLSTRRLPADARRLLRTATRNGTELEELIGQILDFERLENGHLQPRLQPTPLYPYLHRWQEGFRPVAERTDITFTYEPFEADRSVEVDIDRTLYRRMFSNLVTNALKFTPPGGEVRITCTLTDSRLRCTVSDTGPGIAPADRSRIFERFYQTESGRLSGKGSGVGLSIVKAYATLLGGTVTLDTAYEEGARFVLDLPVRVASAVPTAAVETVGENQSAVALATVPPADRPRILVVEDHPELRDYLRLLLETHYAVQTAGHGQEALDLLARDAAYALVLTDLMMPVMDGYALLTELKRHPEWRNIPVVVLTARTGADDRLQALRIGVDDYLTKPFRTERLRAVLAALLANRVGRGSAADDETPAPDPTADFSKNQQWLTEFETYVKSHLIDHDFSVAALARAFAMSESTLLRTLRRLTGLTPARYVQEVRLARARRLLEDGTHTSVKAAAEAVGYADSRSFSRAYRKRFGHLPSKLLSVG